MGINQPQVRKRKHQDWMLQNGGLDQGSGSEHLAKPQLEPLPPVQKSRTGGPLLRNLALITTGSLATMGLLTVAGLWRMGGQFFDRLSAIFAVATPPAQVDIRSMVVQQVRGASELTTAIYSMESVVPTSRERTLGNYVIGKTTLLYIAHGEVRAGVDLATLQPSDVQVVGEAITLRLPPPKILDSKIDVNRSKVYDYDRGFMGLGPDVAPELQELAQRETLAKIVETACTSGVLQSANDRAKLTVSQLLTTAGYRQLTVEPQPPIPKNCVAPNLSPAPTLSPTIAPTVVPTVAPTMLEPNPAPSSVSPPANPVPSLLPAPEVNIGPVLPQPSPSP
jgi:Protein of unknown function (DUF4230)